MDPPITCFSISQYGHYHRDSVAYFHEQMKIYHPFVYDLDLDLDLDSIDKKN